MNSSQLDIPRLRADTRGCESRLHLNNAGAALMPRQVVGAMREHLSLEEQIGGYEAADAAHDSIERSYDSIARLIGARRANVAVTGSATAAFVQALSSFDLTPGDTILTTRCDYTSNQIMYLALASRLGARVIYADDLPSGGVDPDSVADIVRRQRPRFVAVSWIPTNSGLVQDVAAVGEVCERFDVPFIVDACQAVGQLPVDVASIRCDYLSATARKFLRGPRGVGFLFASDRALARGDHPLFTDMRGARWVAASEYRVADSARRYEEWEFAYALVIGQGVAVDYALDVGIEAARTRSWALAESLRDRLGSLSGVRVLDRGATRCAIVTVDRDGVDSRRLVQELTRRGINTVVSLREFGQFDFADKNVDAAVRISPHYYNSDQEIDSFIGAFEEASRAIAPVQRSTGVPAR